MFTTYSILSWLKDAHREVQPFLQKDIIFPFAYSHGSTEEWYRVWAIRNILAGVEMLG